MNEDGKKERLWNYVTGYETDEEVRRRKKNKWVAGLLLFLLLFTTPFILMVVFNVGFYVIFGFIASIFGIDYP